MMSSPDYSTYSLNDLRRTVLPPLSLNQYHLVRDKDGNPTCYASWAYLTKHAAHGFITKTRLLQPNDWAEGYELWMIDFISDDGDVRQMVKWLHNSFPGQQAYHMRRNNWGVVRGKYGKKVEYDLGR